MCSASIDTAIFFTSRTSENPQFEVFLRDRSAQRPKVGGIVVLHVHEITDVGILRMIVNLSLQREVAVRPVSGSRNFGGARAGAGGWAGDRASRNEERHRTRWDG
jgi:hypothetical protein